MADQRRSSAYLGPDKGRWAPAVWSDVVEAAIGGLLDESHWVDLKQELPAGKATFNTELAKDLASLAVDGGLLVIGVEDHDSRAGNVRGVELGKMADRVDQIARGKVRPPLVVRCHEIPHPDRPGWGCLLVHVPSSDQAPHMVDYVYYGRGDRANAKLGDEQVRAILEGRAQGRADIMAELRRMAEEDPMAADRGQLGHYYFLAQPEVAAEDALIEFLDRGDFAGIQGILAEIVRDRGNEGFEPDVLRLSQHVRRAEGVALISFDPEEGPRHEEGLLELVIREDGGIRLTCGRGTGLYGGAVLPVPGKPPLGVLPLLVVGLTYAGAALAGRLADQYAAYQGQWRVGLRMDRLRGVVPADRLAYGSFGPGNPYSREEYEHVTSATTEELVNAPEVVAERVVERLLRGLGIAARYLPYKPERRPS
jgi:hypothetical protein